MVRYPAIVLAACTLASCALTTSLDEFSEAPNAGGADASSASSDAAPLGPSCGSAGFCTDAPPAGWKFVLLGEKEAGCPLGYNGAGSVVVGLHWEPMTCPCSCGAPTGNVTCSNDFTYRVGTDAACSGSPAGRSGNGSCSNLLGLPTNMNHLRLTASTNPFGGSCTQVSTMPTKPPVTHDRAWRLCNAQVDPLPDTCPGGSLCLRDPGSSRVCVRSSIAGDAGPVSCPAGYPNKVAASAQVLDERRCSGFCTCKLSGSCTGAKWQLWKASDCPGAADAIAVVDDACHPITSANYNSSIYTPATPTGVSCVVDQSPVPSGSVTLGATFEYCCR